jgi:hypothetical protein
MSATMASATRTARHEERTFRRGQEAAARLIRALVVPDRPTQLAIARLLVETGTRASTIIEQARQSDMLQDRWAPHHPEAEAIPDLAQWYREGVSDDVSRRSGSLCLSVFDAS